MRLWGRRRSTHPTEHEQPAPGPLVLVVGVVGLGLGLGLVVVLETIDQVLLVARLGEVVVLVPLGVALVDEGGELPLGQVLVGEGTVLLLVVLDVLVVVLLVELV